ncbi:MAG: MFS transporter [Catenulispora sp. 13_1_20CM_3_70_7]|nr:MHS family MFS transporter [Catenulisporales bacterium]OLE22008.1 MAG: MFS transporter [Catenulispora sp. 13_1_20CM_3_70_7]
MTTHSEPVTSPSPRSPDDSTWKVVGASMVGTTLEWYDFFLYGTAAAVVFPKVFFVKSDPLTATLLSFLTYALGFAARPLGGIVFGHIGDRVGRKRTLLVSLVIMGVATTGMAFIPTYKAIGVWAPILLTSLRMVQGFALGGEWGGAVLIVAERDKARRGFWASFPQAGAPLGLVLGTGAIILLSENMSEKSFLDWGWRVAFGLSAILLLVGVWVRRTLNETEAFRAALRKKEDAPPKLPVFEVFRTSWREILIAFGTRMAENISFYIVATFSVTWITQHLKLPKSFGLDAVMLGAAVETVLIPLAGALSDRIGRRPVYLAGAIGIGVWTPIFFALVDQKSYPLAVLAVTVALAFHGLMYGPQAAFFAEMFPTGVRYSGASIGYQVASVVAGAPAPLIAVAILEHNGGKTVGWLSLYLGLAAAVTVIALIFARETRTVPLSGGPVSDQAVEELHDIVH